MGCEECEKQDGSQGVAYYRWGTANIGILACPKHAKEVIYFLNKYVRAERVKGMRK